MLSIHNLSKNFGIQPVLQNINFNISAGERIGLIGANCSASASARSAKALGQLCSMEIKKPSPCMRAKAFRRSAVLQATIMGIRAPV